MFLLTFYLTNLYFNKLNLCQKINDLKIKRIFIVLDKLFQLDNLIMKVWNIMIMVNSKSVH